VRRYAIAFALLCTGCPVKPPASQFPNGQAAIDSMRKTTLCARGLSAEAKVDYLGPKDRVRVDVSVMALKRANLRLSVLAFNNMVATLATNGDKFQLQNFQTKQFLYGPAQPCNMARLTTLSLPPHVLTDALLGQAPVLKHEPAQVAIEWDGSGYYVVRFPGTNDSNEELHLEVHPDDWNKPWGDQRLRVIDILVKQKGYTLYHVDFDDFQAAKTGEPIKDPEGIDPPIMPSGPACDAELPRKIHVEVPEEGNDVRFRYDKAFWNPPLPLGANQFVLPPLAGLQPIYVDCQ
jgi:hypothetical protein